MLPSSGGAMASQTRMSGAPHDAASELQELISQLPQEDQRRVEQVSSNMLVCGFCIAGLCQCLCSFQRARYV